MIAIETVLTILIVFTVGALIALIVSLFEGRKEDD